MDMSKIGLFLQQLRKERGLTQEQLGEQLGVTGKTVSRWETGTYLPPAEMLQLLSSFYGLTINELLEGQRASSTPAPSEAPASPPPSIFPLDAQKQYWTDKWMRDHRWSFVLLLLLFAAAQLAGLWLDNIRINAISAIITIGAAVFLRNARDNYVEHHLYDENLPRD